MQTLKIEQNRQQGQQILIIIKGHIEKAQNAQQAIEKLITYIQQQKDKPGALTIRLKRRKPLRTKNIVFVCDPINIIHHKHIKDALRELGYIPLSENHRGITFVLGTKYVSVQELIESEVN
jgi:hypothetical protein